MNLLLFGSVIVAAWFLVIYFWPLMLLYVYRRAILVKGFGEGPVPVNTLYTGTRAGEYVISGPGWKGAVPQGMAQISSPNNSVLVLGRTLVESENDLPATGSEPFTSWRSCARQALGSPGLALPP